MIKFKLACDARLRNTVWISTSLKSNISPVSGAAAGVAALTSVATETAGSVDVDGAPTETSIAGARSLVALTAIIESSEYAVVLAINPIDPHKNSRTVLFKFMG
jgi:hypothetical protein